MAVASQTTACRIDSLLAETVRRHPGQAAVVWGDTELDYRALSLAADQLAERMLRSGSVRGARVVVIAPNVPALVVALFATWMLEAVAVPLSARLREHEIRRVLEDAEPTLVLAVDAHLGFSFRDLLNRLLPDASTVRRVIYLGSLGDVESEVEGTANRDAEPLGPDVGGLLYTSGTTGAPQGALVSHGREVGAARELASALRLATDDSTAFVVPIAHAFGFTCLLSSISVGCSAILVESTFSPRPLLEAIKKLQVSVLHGSPALFASLLAVRPAGIPGIRGYVAGASPPPGLLARLDDAGMSILNQYGLTETGAVSCCRPDDPPLIRHTTAGKPLPGFELRVAGPRGAGDRLGELEVRGTAATPGYHRRPVETAAALTADGWFRTGDLATIEDGYLEVAGRAKEIVNVGGFNVFPAEVEGALLEHPDIQQSAVIGVPDERLGEVLQAFVVRRSGSDLTAAGVLAFAREHVAGYKLPYSTRFVEEIPLLPSGKVDRRALASLDGEGG